MTKNSRRAIAGLALVAAVAGGVLTLRARARGTHSYSAWFAGSWVPRGWFEEATIDEGADVPDAATVAWCAEGLTAIPGGGCLALPEGAPPWPLVMYLHGIFDPAAASDELDRQARVAKHAVAGGFAMVALRGHVGFCSNPEYASRVCWPSNERNEDAGPGFVAEWTAPLGVAARRGAKGRRYVLGFSNGGYFSGLLAERAWFEAAGFVVSRGGPVQPVKASGAKAPMLLTLSEDDPSHDEMVKLDEELGTDGWPHERYIAHGGHALPDEDIAAAVAFFAKQEAAR